MKNQPRIILQDKPSAAEILVYWTLMGFFLAITFFGIALYLNSITLFRNIFLVIALGSLFVSALRIFIDLIERELSLYTLTDQVLITRRGFTQRTNTIPVEHIQQILVRKPIVGQIMNYGSLIIKAPGFSFVKIDRVPNPEKWQEAILELRHIH